jgi:parallel beta-helix repeat protein
MVLLKAVMLTATWTTGRGASLSVSLSEAATAAEQTHAIQNALDTVAAAGGGTVTLSAGDWTLAGTGKAADGCIQVGSNTILEGAGAGQTVLTLADGSSAVTGIIRTDSGNTRANGTYTTVNAVTIRGLTIDGNRTGSTGEVDGFYCGPKPGTSQADTNITLDGVEIRNCSRYGFDPHEQTIGLTIRNSSAHDNTLDGIVLDYCSDVTLENNRVENNGRHGINIVTGSHGVTLINNTATNNGGSGIVVQTGDNEIRALTRNVTISGGSVSGNGAYGVDVHQASDIAVTDVATSGNVYQGINLAGVTGATLDNNTFDGNGGLAPVRRATYVQDFNDADSANDRAIATTGVVIEGVAAAATSMGAGQVAWAYVITTGNDVLTGSDGADTLAMDAGNDTANGGAGDDVIYGNDGHDVLSGGTGHDALYGGQGNDRLVYTGGTLGGIDTLDGGNGRDIADFLGLRFGIIARLSETGVAVFAAGGVALAVVENCETLRGTSYVDAITGDAAANRLFGCAGRDTIDGGAGNDLIAGGRDADVLSGGAGTDTFRTLVRDGVDTIIDFENGVDLLEFRGVAAYNALRITDTVEGVEVTDPTGLYGYLLAGITAEDLDASDVRLFA